MHRDEEFSRFGHDGQTAVNRSAVRNSGHIRAEAKGESPSRERAHLRDNAEVIGIALPPDAFSSVRFYMKPAKHLLARHRDKPYFLFSDPDHTANPPRVLIVRLPAMRTCEGRVVNWCPSVSADIKNRYLIALRDISQYAKFREKIYDGLGHMCPLAKVIL